MYTRTGLLLIAATLAVGAAQAHHSFSATYNENAEMQIEGKLVQFMFRNPHSFVHVLATDEEGNMQRYAVEWGGAGTLDRQGVKRDTLKVGDYVVITGNPGRNAVDHRMRMQTLHRPADDYTWGTANGENFD
jgi:thiamine monophosphate kinase